MALFITLSGLQSHSRNKTFGIRHKTRPNQDIMQEKAQDKTQEYYTQDRMQEKKKDDKT